MGLLGDPNQPVVDPVRQGTELRNFEPTTSQVLGSYVDLFLRAEGPFATLVTAIDINTAGGSPLTKEEFEASPDFRADIDWFFGITDRQLKKLSAIKFEEEKDQIIRDSASSLQTALGWTAGFISGAGDFLNAGSAFIGIPGVTMGSKFAKLSNLGKGTRRFGRGVVSSAAVESVFLATEETLQRDLTFGELAFNIAFGGFVDAGIGRGLDFFKDRRLRVTLKDHIIVTETSTRNMEQSKHVGIETVIAERERAARARTPGEQFDEFFGREVSGKPELARDFNPAEQFNPGKPAGKGKNAKFPNYTKIKGEDARMIEGVNAEVQQSVGGSRTFLDNPDAPGQTIIGVPSDAPAFFRAYNKGIDAEKKAARKIRQKNKTLPEGQKLSVPTARSAITKKQVDVVTKKMLNNEPLGKNEILIAETLFEEARARREQNVLDMKEEGQLRAIRNEEDIAAGDRGEKELDPLLLGQEQIDEFSGLDSRYIKQTDKFLEDNPTISPEDAELDLEIKELEVEMSELDKLEFLDEGDRAEIEEFNNLVDEGELIARASRSAVACMKGDRE